MSGDQGRPSLSIPKEILDVLEEENCSRTNLVFSVRSISRDVKRTTIDRAVSSLFNIKKLRERLCFHHPVSR